MKMIKNIVFDLGNVLVRFDTESFLNGYSDIEKELFYKEIYRSENWLRFDNGDLTEDELTDTVCSHIPECYRDDAKKLIRWYDLTSQIEGMEQLVTLLKECGYKIYLLSNTSEAFHRYCKRFPVLKHFDGLFISADHHMLKPDARIFNKFCETFSLTPSECVFIDDTEANVNGAKNVGFEGIVFKSDASELKKELDALGVEI